MAHGLLDYDWMMSVKERPWHGIGTIVDEAPNSEEVIRLSKLDWDVVQYPVIANGVEIEGHFANVRTDVNYPLGIVKNRYKIVQNKQAFSFVDEIIEDVDGASYETAGSLFNGRKTFMLVKLSESKLLDDDVENYMFFTNSHDGSSAVTAGITNVRVVCNNTLQLAIKGAKRVWRLKHTLRMDGRAKEAQMSLKLANSYIDGMGFVANSMATKKVNKDWFLRALAESNPLKLSESTVEAMNERIDLIYTNKDDLQNYRGSAWGLYNAVADLVSNTKPFKNTKTYADNKLNNFFDGYRLLEASQNILQVA